MQLSERGYLLLKYFEGLRLAPYRCSAGVPSIGYGNTFYPNGVRVTMRDKPITKQRAEDLLRFVAALFEKDVDSLVKVALKVHQRDALICFAYNVGSDIDQDSIPEGLGDSTLLKLVNKNPDDPAIVAEFLKWNKAKGKVVDGLVRRRTAESYYYATGNLSLKLH